MPKQKKTKKVSSKKKKELVKAIKNPTRWWKLDFGRYGGEVAMGEITEAQFNFWYGKEDDLAQYMNDRGFDPAEANEKYGVPEDARFDREFYEYEDIVHTSGPELSDGQLMTITEVDEQGNSLQNEDGSFVEDVQIPMEHFKKKGIKVVCAGEHHSGSDSCKDKYYIFGQYFNKGGWYTEELIKTDHRGLDFKKMEIDYENCDGFKVFHSVKYNAIDYYLQEDSTGKSSSFYVMEGDDV